MAAAELMRADEAFAAFDANGDGDISLAEVKRYLKDRADLKARLGVDSWGGFFRRWDTDASGALSRAEFYELWGQLGFPGPEQPDPAPDAAPDRPPAPTPAPAAEPEQGLAGPVGAADAAVQSPLPPSRSDSPASAPASARASACGSAREAAVASPLPPTRTASIFDSALDSDPGAARGLCPIAADPAAAAGELRDAAADSAAAQSPLPPTPSSLAPLPACGIELRTEPPECGGGAELPVALARRIGLPAGAVGRRGAAGAEGRWGFEVRMRTQGAALAAARLLCSRLRLRNDLVAAQYHIVSAELEAPPAAAQAPSPQHKRPAPERHAGAALPPRLSAAGAAAVARADWLLAAAEERGALGAVEQASLLRCVHDLCMELRRRGVPDDAPLVRARAALVGSRAQRGADCDAAVGALRDARAAVCAAHAAPPLAVSWVSSPREARLSAAAVAEAAAAASAAVLGGMRSPPRSLAQRAHV